MVVIRGAEVLRNNLNFRWRWRKLIKTSDFLTCCLHAFAGGADGCGDPLKERGHRAGVIGIEPHHTLFTSHRLKYLVVGTVHSTADDNAPLFHAEACEALHPVIRRASVRH